VLGLVQVGFRVALVGVVSGESREWCAVGGISRVACCLI